MAANKQPPTEKGTIVEIPSRPQVHALPDYSRANVAGILVASSQMTICHIPACTSQFFEGLANKPSGPQDPNTSVVPGPEVMVDGPPFSSNKIGRY
jgi:hypothetical protein